MKNQYRRSLAMFLLALFTGCAGYWRSCSSCNAESFGADWVIVQMDMNGYPYRCWELPKTSVSNEPASDGIYWEERGGGNLVHISGHYNRVQVVGANWDRAFAELGLTRESCKAIQSRRFDDDDGVNAHGE
jgi:hypothetical protein